MKYNLHINQVKCQEWWLNIQQWILMWLFTQLSTWAEWKEIDWNIYYYFSANKIIQEVPIITNNKRTILTIIKWLKDKELLDHIIINNKWYYKISDMWKSYISDNNNDSASMQKNAQGYAKKCTPSMQKNAHNNNTSNTSTNYNKESKRKYWEYSHVLLKDSEKDKFIKDFWKNEFDKYIKILDEWIELRGYI